MGKLNVSLPWKQVIFADRFVYAITGEKTFAADVTSEGKLIPIQHVLAYVEHFGGLRHIEQGVGIRPSLCGNEKLQFGRPPNFLQIGKELRQVLGF